MTRPVILLGAGASIDAGLSDTYELTERVYSALRTTDPISARLLGFVIAKLVVRNARKGETPYKKLNIEEVYDALKRVLNRDDDLIGEFVSSWEPLVETPRERTSTFEIRDHLERSIRFHSGLRGGQIVVDQDHLRKAIEGLLNTSASPSVDSTQVLSRCTDVLADMLDPDGKKLEYLSKFLGKIDGKVECVATLNYDTLLEDAAKSNDIDFDYGLSDWNSKRLIRYKPAALRLLKLHGSVNWYIRDSDEVDFQQRAESWRGLPRGMIFGGQYDKLNPNGPFLSLRHEFQRSLSKATTVAIVGYSFGDDHLNAMLRSWIAVKRKAKLIVLDPQGILASSRLTGRIAAWTGQKLVSDTVEFQEIKGGFSDNVDVLCDALWSAPKPAGRPKPSSQKQVSRRKAGGAKKAAGLR